MDITKKHHLNFLNEIKESHKLSYYEKLRIWHPKFDVHNVENIVESPLP